MLIAPIGRVATCTQISIRSASSREDAQELDPGTYGFTDADYDRKIFLIASSARIRHAAADHGHSPAHLLPDARRRVYAYLRSPAEGWIQERIEGPDKEITFTREGKRAILNKLVEAEGFGKVLRPQIHRHQTVRAGRCGSDDSGARANHQARRCAWRERTLPSAWPSRPAQCARPRSGEATSGIFHEFKGGSSSPDEVTAPETSNITWRLIGSRIRSKYRSPVADGESVAPGKSSIRSCS